MKTLRIFMIAFMAVALSTACGDKKTETASPAPDAPTAIEEAVTEAEPEEAPEPVAKDGVTQVTITGNDQMKYDLKTITVKAGEKVELTLKHVGKMAKNVMGHNWVLVQPDTDLGKLGVASAGAVDTDYIPEAYKDQIIVFTKMLGGGESDVITFDAPEPGTYIFLCTFPGHHVMMRGEFIVE